MLPRPRATSLLFLLFLLFSCGKNESTSELVLVRDTSTVTRTTAVGNASSHWIIFTSNGSQDPTNVKITLPGAPFTVLRNECGANRSPEIKYYTCTIYFEFKPPSAGTYNDRIVLEYNNNGTAGTTTSKTVDLNFTAS